MCNNARSVLIKEKNEVTYKINEFWKYVVLQLQKVNRHVSARGEFDIWRNSSIKRAFLVLTHHDNNFQVANNELLALFKPRGSPDRHWKKYIYIYAGVNIQKLNNGYILKLDFSNVWTAIPRHRGVWVGDWSEWCRWKEKWSLRSLL